MKRKLMFLLTAVIVFSLMITPAHAATFHADIIGPSGSGQFGFSVTTLPNGNFVVTDPSYDAGPVTDVGAVYLYNGATRALISTLTGSTANDQIGSNGIVVLPNGNYVVVSTAWHGVGAVTWDNGTTGVSGVVSAANSLVGSTAGDQVGYGFIALTNGNYVVKSPGWSNSRGAVTWSSGTSGISGVVSAANSLVGSTAGDGVGGTCCVGGVTALTNGNYVVNSPYWNNGTAFSAGAVTWGSGTTGLVGVVSPANSLVGSTAGDGFNLDVTMLMNGNYVVTSSEWDNNAAADAGAVTWGSGTTGVSGIVSPANSLVGSTAGDQVGNFSVTTLTNGNYVVASSSWDNGAAVDVGAVTWDSGTSGVRGLVSAANSLVGSTVYDQVGYDVTALPNGNYVVASPYWQNGMAWQAGAVTWGNGTTGVRGVISAANSLVGSTAHDQIGGIPYWDSYFHVIFVIPGIMALTNGNYVVSSTNWDGVGAVTWGNGTSGVRGVVSAANSLVGVGSELSEPSGSHHSVTALTNGNYVVASPHWAGVGAVTWGSGTSGVSGVVSAANSLVGSTSSDSVGNGGVTALTNGNYVVASPWRITWGNGTTGVSGIISSANSLIGDGSVTALTNGNYVVVNPWWDNGTATDVGAVTWGSGATSVSDVVSAANSLVGSTAGDQVGYDVKALANGNYVVASRYWDNGTVADAGAVTWGSGATGVSGVVSAANSLVGSTAGDFVGSGVTALPNSNYVVDSGFWHNGTTVDSGAITLGKSTSAPLVGPITAANSVLGTAASGGNTMNFAYDAVHDQLVVGRPTDNIVTLFNIAPGPRVTSSVRINPSPTNLASVDFTVTFSDSVTGVDASDFALTTSGVTGASITNVSGSGTTYTVTVNTDNGNGKIRLDVLDDDSIQDAANEPLGGAGAGNGSYTSGDTYKVIKSAQPITTGVFRPSNGLLYLKNTNTTGIADIAINYGLGGDYPVVGDWDGNGTATIGIYRNGSFYLRNSNTLGFADLVFAFGQSGDQPIAGDWDGNGIDTIGVYRPATGQFLLRNSNKSGAPDMSFYLGNVGDVGIAADWDGDGKDTTGVFRPSNGVIFLKNTNTTGFADVALNYGVPGDQPVTGDWDGDGIDTIGVYRNAQFLLRNSNDIGFADISFYLGNPGDMPIAGDWDGLP